MKDIYNVALMLCASCNRHRIRNLARAKKLAESGPDTQNTHIMSKAERDQKQQVRKHRNAILNALDGLNANDYIKLTVTEAIRPLLYLIADEVPEPEAVDSGRDDFDDVSTSQHKEEEPVQESAQVVDNGKPKNESVSTSQHDDQEKAYEGFVSGLSGQSEIEPSTSPLPEPIPKAHQPKKRSRKAGG